MLLGLKGSCFIANMVHSFFLFHVHLEKLQKRAFDLVSNAYTSIRAEDLARLMGVKTEVAVSGE